MMFKNSIAIRKWFTAGQGRRNMGCTGASLLIRGGKLKSDWQWPYIEHKSYLIQFRTLVIILWELPFARSTFARLKPVFAVSTFNNDRITLSFMQLPKISCANYYKLKQTLVIFFFKKMQEKFVDKVKEVIKEWFGENPEESPDLCRVVSDRHFDRLANLISSSTGNVVFGKVFFYYFSI